MERGNADPTTTSGRGTSSPGRDRVPGPIGSITRVIDLETVKHVARLARLRLDTEEEKAMGDELNAILTHVDEIQSLDLDGVEPTSHVIRLENVLRPDEPHTSLSQDLALREGPSTADGGFIVPQIG